MASRAARHQSAGSCSAHPMCSEWMGACSLEQEVMTWPARLTSTARVPPVPTSMPRNMERTSSEKMVVVGKCICLELWAICESSNAISAMVGHLETRRWDSQDGSRIPEAQDFFALFSGSNASNTYSQTATDERVASEPPE